MKDISRVSILAVGNVVAAQAGNFLDSASKILHVFLMLGQVGVAIVTITYIWKKIRALRKPPK